MNFLQFQLDQVKLVLSCFCCISDREQKVGYKFDTSFHLPEVDLPFLDAQDLIQSFARASVCEC